MLQSGNPRRPWRTLLHMLAFGALLALGIMLAKGPPDLSENGARLVFTEADVAQIRASFERTWGHPPTTVELGRAFERHVRDEIFYREALAQGIDRNDPVVRMSLVRKITMMGTAQAAALEPADEELEAYFKLRQERYRIQGSVSLLQVCRSGDGAVGDIEADARELLADLRRLDPRPEDLAAMSDISMLPTVCSEMTEEELASTFGAEFQAAVMALAPGQWAGIVESTFGFHAVKVTHRTESRIPSWNEVRDRITTDMRYEGRRAAEDQFYAELLPRYQIVYNDGVTDALEGTVRGSRAIGEK